MREIEDRDRRKNNIISFGIKEISSEDIEARKEHDISEVEAVLSAGLGITTELDKPVRLGLRREKSKDVRPSRIKVVDDGTRSKILKTAENLAESGEEMYK